MVLGLLVSNSASSAKAEESQQAQHFVEVTSLSFDRPFWVAVSLPLNDGEAIQLNSKFWDESLWQLPKGFHVAQVLYPLPNSYLGGGNVAIYTKAITLLYEIVPPPAYETNNAFANIPYGFKHTLTWSLCDDFCNSQAVEFNFELYVGEGQIDASEGDVFIAARQASLPPLPWPVEAYIDSSSYDISIVAEQADFFSHMVFIPTQKMFTGGVATLSSYQDGNYNLEGEVFVPQEIEGQYFKEISGILASYDGQTLSNGYRIVAENKKQEVITWSPREPSKQTGYSFITALALAFLGGLILNLMPCVFPILAMKAFQFAAFGQKTTSQIRQDGIAYTLGILTSFILVAVTLMAIRGMGGMVGWGFQLQSPIFILGLVWVMLAVSLNFLGVFNFNFPALQNLGNSKLVLNIFGGGERAKAFSTGVLATVVATPCTAPFMAPAIGYALMQPPLGGLSIFLMLGLGLAFPYLLLSYVPAFAAHLPKSGAWMLKVQRWLALPLGLTVVWLVWVLAQQISSLALVIGLLSLVFLVVALYSKTKWRAVSSIIIGLLLVVYVGQSRSEKMNEVALPGIVDGLETIVWSPQAVKAYRAENRAIFLNVTAAWCITCLVHEKLVFENDSFQAYMKESNIIYMVADWTNPDARIAQLLEQHGRSGIPFYMFYPADQTIQPVLLPSVLTPATTIRILEKNQ
jgi:thiol:disulfide interchange protein DsbD